MPLSSLRERSIRWRVGGHLLLILLLIVVNLGSIGWFLTEQKHDGAAINEAGKQRLLVEQMASEAHLVGMGNMGARADLAADAAQFNRTLTALLDGNQSRGIPPAPPAVRDQFLSVRAEWEPFYIHIRIILEEPRTSTEFNESLQYIAAHNDQLLAASDTAVSHYERTFEKKVTQLQFLLVGIFGLDLLVIPLLFAFTDRHILQPIEQMAAEARTIASGDMDASITPIETTDEVGDLSKSLNEMKTQLVSAAQDAQRFEQAVEHAGHAIYITGTDGTIEYVNPAFEEITKYDADEAVGENPRILNSGQQSESYYDELWDTITSGGVWREEVINKRATGELFHAYQTIAPITGVDSDRAGFVAIMSDNTEQIISNQQNQVLRRVLRHNLRTELNLIGGYVQKLRNPSDDETRDAYVTKVENRIESLVSLSTSVDRFARTFKQGPHWQQELGATIDNVCDALEDRYSAAKFEINTPSSEVTVLANVALVCEEIVENAIEHNDRATPEVTVTVTVEDEPDPPPTVRIEIEDNGPGIPSEERQVIEHGEETPLLHGSGLGLWISYWMVTLAGGDITIEDRQQRGTRISIVLPRASVNTVPDVAVGGQNGHTAANDQTEDINNTTND
jgi:PAS domain S-box-containing protein